MSKVPAYIGWYRPHEPVNWDGLVPDPKTGELIKEPSMTKQSFMAECDINNIIKAFSTTGQIAHINEKAAQGAYIDLPDAMEFQEALHLSMAAQASFDTLPSGIRARFENDPAQFLEFMADPRNGPEMVKLGLATERAQAPSTSENAQSPTPVPKTNENASKEPPKPA